MFAQRDLEAILTPREEMIVRMRFGIRLERAYNLKEIGEQFAVSRERIRQIEYRALRKLRQSALNAPASFQEPIEEPPAKVRETPPETVSSGDALKAATLKLMGVHDEDC